jgi:hypothetical protein
MLAKGLWLIIAAAGLIAAGSSSVTVALTALAVLAGLVGILCLSSGAAQLAVVQLALELIVIYYLAKVTKTSMMRNGWSLFAVVALGGLAVAAGNYWWPALSVLANTTTKGEGAVDWVSLIGGVIVFLTAVAGALAVAHQREEKA